MFDATIVSIVSAILLIIVTPLLSWCFALLKYKSLKNVAGPKPLPIIGNANELGTTTVESFMRLQKQYGTFYKLWLGPRLHLLITKPESLEFLLNSNIHLSKSDGYDLFKPWLGDGLLVSTGQKWRARRKMITPTFHFKILEQFLDVFNKQINILVDNLLQEAEKSKDSIEVHQFVNLCSLDIICETAFGTAINAQSKGNPKYVWAVTALLEIITLRFFSVWLRNPLIFRLSPQYGKYKESLKILHEFTNGIIKQRRREFELNGKSRKTGGVADDSASASGAAVGGGNDDDHGIKIRAALLDMLLEASQQGGQHLTDEDIRDEVDTFMFEGHDTSSTAISFVLYALAKHSEVQRKVHQEIQEIIGNDAKTNITTSHINNLKYLDIVVKECMRMYPPVPLIERRLEEDCKIDNINIKKGTNISIFLYGMGYNPEIFPNPEHFNPERFLPEKQAERHSYGFVPFSAGPRNCIGQKYAVMELKVCIVKILLQFELLEDPNFHPQIGMCSVLKSRNGIKLKLKIRND